MPALHTGRIYGLSPCHKLKRKVILIFQKFVKNNASDQLCHGHWALSWDCTWFMKTGVFGVYMRGPVYGVPVRSIRRAQHFSYFFFIELKLPYWFKDSA